MLCRVVVGAAVLAASADAFMPSTPALASLRTSNTQLSASKINVNNIQPGEAKVVNQARIICELLFLLILTFLLSSDHFEGRREGSLLSLLEEWNLPALRWKAQQAQRRGWRQCRADHCHGFKGLGLNSIASDSCLRH